MSQRTEPTAKSAIPQRTWATGDAASATTDSGWKTPSATCRELQIQGFTAVEAGNLTAYLNGIRPVEGGWTIDEIDRLLFTRHLVRHGSDDAYTAS